jgi:acyl-CoA reductase-like NAD-dependent aldehyde dehydrogenase
MRKARLFIDGEWTEPSSSVYGRKLNPSTGEVYGEFASGSREDALRAVDSAYDAGKRWEETTSAERARILFRTAELIRSARQDLEAILVDEVGKPAVEARQEVDGVLDQITYYAEFARKITGDIVEGTRHERWIHQYRVPYGVVVAITPWNFPAAMNARKVAPALLTGNTVVLKPSSDTPFSAEWMVRMFERAGIPRGVLNFVTGPGSEIGNALTSSMKVSLVTLTGETGTGKEVMKSASANMAKLILELGGKAPFIVWKDADLELAARSLMWAKFWNAGQSCIAAERLFVHEEVHEKFMERFLSLVRSLRVGDPRRNEMGPLINERQRQKVEGMVAQGEKEGMKPVYGARRPELAPPLSGGFHYMPTVLEGEGGEGTLFSEEIFGPVLPATKVAGNFGSLLDSLNTSSYGLASYLYTRDLSLALRASSELRFGELYVNMTGPEASQGYHTGFRLSGQAGEGSKHGIEEYVKIKNVYLDYGERPLDGEVIPPYGGSP